MNKTIAIITTGILAVGLFGIASLTGSVFAQLTGSQGQGGGGGGFGISGFGTPTAGVGGGGGGATTSTNTNFPTIIAQGGGPVNGGNSDPNAFHGFCGGLFTAAAPAAGGAGGGC